MFKRLIFWYQCKRIGPDIPLTHWMLYFPALARLLLSRKLGAIGKESSIRPGSYLVGTKSIFIGDQVVIRPGSHIHADPDDNSAEIIIENKVLIGSAVHIYIDTHEFSDVTIPIFNQGFRKKRSVVIREGSWIGAASIILPGVVIGKNSVVAAGSVVTRSVPDRVLVGGSPAVTIRKLV